MAEVTSASQTLTAQANQSDWDAYFAEQQVALEQAIQQLERELAEDAPKI